MFRTLKDIAVLMRMARALAAYDALLPREYAARVPFSLRLESPDRILRGQIDAVVVPEYCGYSGITSTRSTRRCASSSSTPQRRWRCSTRT